ncbi:squamous cell carcinoma antigen recognized by T-cells 3, partial [Tremellales sp. Uapishka_1]
MEVDPSPPQASEVLQDSDALAQEAAFADLDQLLPRLEDQPENVELLQKQIQLMQQLQMTEQVEECVKKLSELVMLSEDLWLSFLDGLIGRSTAAVTLEILVDIMEAFDRAEKDYLSLAILLRHIDFIVTCSRSVTGAIHDGSALFVLDEDVIQFLSEDTVRDMLGAVVRIGEGLLSESHLLWQPWVEWEMSLLERKSGPPKQEEIDLIHGLFKDRMSTPHLMMDATSSAYSTFCSQHCPNDYTERMIAVTNSSQEAKAKMSSEKRHGKTREDMEQEIVTTQAQVYLSYINWEADPRVKSTKQGGGKAPAQDPLLIRTVFERAVAAFARVVTGLEIGVAIANVSLESAKAEVSKKKTKDKKGKGKMRESELNHEADLDQKTEEHRVAMEAVKSYKDMEASVWSRYSNWAEARGVPDEELNMLFERALALGKLTAPYNSVNGLVDLFAYRAASERRLLVSEDETEDYHPVMPTLMRGFELVTDMNKAGDPSLKLEKFLLSWVETSAPYLLHQAMAVLDKPSKARSASYQMILLRAGVEARQGNIEQTRQLFLNGISRSDLDWPEAVYEAFAQFENVHGTLETLAESEKKIDKEREKVTRRREKAAQEQNEIAQQYQQMSLAAQPEVEAIEVGVVVPSATSLSVAPTPVASSEHIKRDREHSTILVTGLAKGIDIARIAAFFEDCGPIRETQIFSESERETDAALVEFRSAEAIPVAITRDMKRIDGQEVAVSMLWRSTLFVANFPKDMDDAGIRALISPYGTILETRWPSKKYAESRRFCYVTMASPSSAEKALELHGTQPTPGFGLTVLISDPSAKIKRSDAANSTLFVGGLTAQTTEADVRQLFEVYGNVRNVKLGWNREKNVSRGFAFVDMSSEDEAKAAQTVHGTSYKGKYLKVEISDPNFAAKKGKDARSFSGQPSSHADDKKQRPPIEKDDKKQRSIRLYNLPEGAQEGLVQQALEKIVPVRRLEIFAQKHEAVVELASPADVGKVMLQPFVYEGVTIEITAHGAGKSTRPLPKADDIPSDPSNPLAFAPRPPRLTGKAKAIGKGRVAPKVDKALPPIFTSAEGGSRSQDDFRAFLNAKNKQREGNLLSAQARTEESLAQNGGEKRSLEEGEEEQDTKRSKLA